MFRHREHKYQPLHPRKSRRPFILAFGLVCLIPIGLFALSLVTFLTSSVSRPCLPFSLQRISTSGHRLLSCSSLPHQSGGLSISGGSGNLGQMGGHGAAEEDVAVGLEGGTGRVGGFLQSQKESFMEDLSKKNLKGWTIAMGNEAGDLDSLSSSIGFAYLSQTLRAERSIPLILTPSSLMRLRPENLLVLRNCRIPQSSLLHLESIPDPKALAGLGAKFALVDHNRLLPAFSSAQASADGSQDPVVAIIDHHDDEHQHASAPLRELTVPTGSCASLVTEHFQSTWTSANSSPAGQAGSPIPPELATLLLSAILIDTAGLKVGGKATAVDNTAASFLYPLSSLPGATSTESASLLESDGSSGIAQLTSELQKAKYNVSDMSTHDLLLRDYKEYTLPTSSSSFPALQVGLSTVPLGMKDWVKRDGGWDALLKGVDEQMAGRKLDIEGVLTTFENKNGKHRRELLVVLGTGRAIGDLSTAKRVLHELEHGLEGSSEIELKPWDKNSEFFSKQGELDSSARIARVWRQDNAKATRKQVAPLMRDLVAGLH